MSVWDIANLENNFVLKWCPLFMVTNKHTERDCIVIKLGAYRVCYTG